MIPHLFKSDTTEFNSLGLGALTRTISCNVVEELNGAYELNMTVLADDPLIEFIQIGNIIAVNPNMVDTVQAFVIEEIRKNIDGTVEVYAPHISQHRTKLIPFDKFATNSLAGVVMTLNSQAIESNPFTFSTDKTSSKMFQNLAPKSYRDMLGGTEGSILDTFGGEYFFNNFDISLLTRRGRETDAHVVYGRNMTDFLQDSSFDWDGSTTGVLPYWTNSEGVADVVGAVQYSQYADLYPYKKTVAIDFSDKFEEAPTQAELEAFASAWINSKGLPAITLEVGFNQFDTTSAEVNTLQLGDTVTVINSVYNVNYKSRIVSYDFNVLSETYKSITVGTKKLTVNEAIAQMTNVTVIKKSGISVTQESSGSLVVG